MSYRHWFEPTHWQANEQRPPTPGGGGSASLLSMSEKQAEQAGKRRKKHPLGFAPPRKRQP